MMKGMCVRGTSWDNAALIRFESRDIFAIFLHIFHDLRLAYALS